MGKGLKRAVAAAKATRQMPYTPGMLKEFDRITNLECSRNQVDRIRGRLAVKAFIEEHGLESCAEMMKVLKAKDARAKSK